MTVLAVVLAVLASVGVFVQRVHATVLSTGMWGYSADTPQIELP